MEKEFNLLEEPWIRVIGSNMTIREVSLIDLFSHAHEFLRLSGEMPTQDAAILRLLLSIAITAFYRFEASGDEDELSEDDDEDYILERWRNYWNLGHFQVEAFENYLEQYKERFWLFHPDKPFWQVAGLKNGTDYGALSIRGNLKESNNKLTKHHFSMADGEGTERLSYSEAARWMIHLNAYGVNVKTDKNAEGDGKPAGTGRLGKLGLFYLEGDNLFETLMINLVPMRENGDLWGEPAPVWERDIRRGQGTLIGCPDNLPELYTIQSRRLLLKRENGFVTGCKVMNGDFYPLENDYTEPMSIWISSENKNGKECVFRPKMHDPSVQVWREFPSLFRSFQENRMPGIVSWVIALREKGCLPRSRRLAYHSVGIAYGDAMCYTYGDCIDDSLTMSSELLAKVNGAWIENISDQVEKCKKTADVAIYYLAGGVSDLIADGNPDFKKGEQRKLKEQFYALIDHPFRKWLREIRPQDDGMAEAMKKWEKQVRSLARHLGEDYILSVSNNICRTREGKNGTLSLPKALNIYYATLNKIYEKEEEGGKDIEKK